MGTRTLICAALAGMTGLGSAASVALVADGSAASYIVPTNGALGASWRGIGFDDSSWAVGPLGIGFGSVVGSGSTALQTDVGVAMRSINATAYVRMSFNILDPATVTALDLSPIIDDGFVAWLNGFEVASLNAPAAPAWNSNATSVNTPEGQANSFDLSGAIDRLVPGQNVLAIHGMNVTPGSSDFLVAPTLTAEIVPEPSSWLMVALAFAGVMFRRRR